MGAERRSVVVIGTGIMGANHVRIASAMPDVDLVAVVDADRARAEAVTAASGARVVSSLAEVIDDVDAAILATPSETHEDIGLQLLEAGRHLLVEKPIATTVDGGTRLVDAAAAAGVVLMVGHVERFNPAALELPRYLDGELIHLRASRISPYSERVRVGVVLDLMIHDLDIVRSLAGGGPVDVQAVAQCVRSEVEDLACAMLRFANGVTADLVASRIGQQKVRQLEVTLDSSVVAADLLRQDITIHRMSHSEYVAEDGPRYRQTGVVEIPFLDRRGEPLVLEQREFFDAIAQGRPPLVSGHDGVEALRLAMAVLAATGRPA